MYNVSRLSNYTLCSKLSSESCLFKLVYEADAAPSSFGWSLEPGIGIGGSYNLCSANPLISGAERGCGAYTPIIAALVNRLSLASFVCLDERGERIGE